jgi:hypothetical protein
VVWRYTYGFNRKQHELSQNFIAEATGLHKKQIQRELNNLIKEIDDDLGTDQENIPAQQEESDLIKIEQHYA